MKRYTEADLAAAWESGYWHGISHTGPMNEAAISAKNPHRNGNSSEGQEIHLRAGLNSNSTDSVALDYSGHTGGGRA